MHNKTTAKMKENGWRKLHAFFPGDTFVNSRLVEGKNNKTYLHGYYIRINGTKYFLCVLNYCFFLNTSNYHKFGNINHRLKRSSIGSCLVSLSNFQG